MPLSASVFGVMSRIFGVFHLDTLSERCARAAVDRAPDCAIAWHQLFVLAAERAATVPPDVEAEQEALSAIQRACQAAPSSFMYARALVCYLSYLGRIDDALAYADSWIRKEPDSGRRLVGIVEQYRAGSTRGRSKDECCCEEHDPKHQSQ